MNIKFYTENSFRNIKQNRPVRHRPLEDYAKIQDFDKLLTLGRKLITKGDKDSYFDAFWCFDLAVRLRPESFEARLGEYKAWYWYCISISQDPTLSITDCLYRILYAYTPREYTQTISNMYLEDFKNVPSLLLEGDTNHE